MCGRPSRCRASQALTVNWGHCTSSAYAAPNNRNHHDECYSALSASAMTYTMWALIQMYCCVFLLFIHIFLSILCEIDKIKGWAHAAHVLIILTICAFCWVVAWHQCCTWYRTNRRHSSCYVLRQVYHHRRSGCRLFTGRCCFYLLYHTIVISYTDK